MLGKGTDFSEESVKKRRGKESANESGSKFNPHFDSSFVEFVQPCFFFSRSVLVLPSNWFPLMRVKWLPLMENSFAVLEIVIAEPRVRATTRSASHVGSSSNWIVNLREYQESDGNAVLLRSWLFDLESSKGVVFMLGKGWKEVFSTWMAFGGNTRDLGSFGEETDKTTTYNMNMKNYHSEHWSGVRTLKRLAASWTSW
ncbi:hypothetical protein Tco_0798155 [Tanacetum coccineum]